MTTILLADIGGTNSRCALGTPDGTIERVQVFHNGEFGQLQALLSAYLAMQPATLRPRRAALAIAAPIHGDDVQMMNIAWRFSCSALKRDFELDDLHVLNDFAALAWALPVLHPEDLLRIGGGTPDPGFPRLVLGPGTGLGVASLIPVGNRWQAIACEGGHVTLAAHDDDEARLISLARQRLGHCSAERLLSGPGLVLLHQLAHGGRELTPEVFGERLAAGDSSVEATLEIFFRLLGTVASNAALTLGALGGVYISGGIVPRYPARFARSGFRQRFESKGRYQDYMRAIPTWLITAPYPALLGLQQFARDGASS